MNLAQLMSYNPLEQALMKKHIYLQQLFMEASTKICEMYGGETDQNIEEMTNNVYSLIEQLELFNRIVPKKEIIL